MSALDRITASAMLKPSGRPSPLARRTERALAAVDHKTMVRATAVAGEELVTTVKLHSLDHLASQAIIGQTSVYRCADAAAGEDFQLREHLSVFVEFARLAKGEVLATTARRYLEEGAR